MMMIVVKYAASNFACSGLRWDPNEATTGYGSTTGASPSAPV